MKQDTSLNAILEDQGKPVRIEDLRGIFHRPGMKPLSVEEMDEAIASFHAEENERIMRGLPSREPGDSDL